LYLSCAAALTCSFTALFAAGCVPFCGCGLGAPIVEHDAERGAVVCGAARFTVLTPAMIRLEWSPDGRFEDRPSYVFVNRYALAPSPYSFMSGDEWLTLETEDLLLRYRRGADRFSSDTLSIRLKADETPITWRPGMKDEGNLGGTVRTLDQASGAVPLQPGLVSRDGWVVFDDSKTFLFDDSDWPWAVERDTSPDTVDWYFLGYGHDYKRCLGDFVEVAGRIPLPPRWAFGAWWSRYWPYSDEELKQLVGEFKNHDVPLDVLVVDMDWHLPGWTGYTWDPKYFPDPEGFLRWCHEQGLHVPLNLHPADGVRDHEAAFVDMAHAMGLDPSKTDHVPFDITNRRYVEAYFKYLHHPLEAQGVDFWWIDWQQGNETGIPGVDPLPWLNYLHWTDMERNPARKGLRPILFSRWGGPGSHRYQVGFSGDTHCNWASLAFQPYFTATAGNAAYPFWSHDLGGHIPGPVGSELYTRWIQFGAFSPIFRSHAGRNPESERRIWAFSPEVFEAAHDAFRLRYELVPYIYTEARRCYDTGLPLLRPLYYEWPEFDESYASPQEYLFGDEMLVAPVTSPRNPETGSAVVDVWFPPGRWRHWFTGRVYDGPGEYVVTAPLREIPLFVREGSIIPAMPVRDRIGTQPLDRLVVHVFPGGAGSFDLYEDDGIGTGYTKSEYALTPLRMTQREGKTEIRIGPVDGGYPGMPSEREVEIRIRDVSPPGAVWVDGMKVPSHGTERETLGPSWTYDSEDLAIVVHVPVWKLEAPLQCRIEGTKRAAAAASPGDLRGRLAALRDIQDLYGDACPESITSALETQTRLMDGGADAWNELADSCYARWEILTGDILRAEVEPERARRAFSRMVGLLADMSVDFDTHSGCVYAEATVGADRPFPGLASNIIVATPPGWNNESDSELGSAALESGGTIRRGVVVSGFSIAKTTVMRTDVELIANGAALHFPLSRAVFPSIGEWWVIGPWECQPDKAMEAVFPPEKGVDLDGRYPGWEGKPVKWQRVVRSLSPDLRPDEEFCVDLLKVFKREECEEAVAYAATSVRVPRDLDAILALGSDDGVAVWVNGENVFRNDAWRAYAPKSDRVPIRLKKGSNAILLKITQGCCDWKFGAHLESPEGDSLEEAEVSLEPFRGQQPDSYP